MIAARARGRQSDHPRTANEEPTIGDADPERVAMGSETTAAGDPDDKRLHIQRRWKGRGLR